VHYGKGANLEAQKIKGENMKKNSVKYLEKLVERGVRKHLPSLKMFRYRERGLETIVKKVVPTKHKDLIDISKDSRWLVTNAPEEYVYGEMIDIDNAIASNLTHHLKRYAQSYMGTL